MNGTNMVSETPFGSLPGSTSEATAGIPLGNPDLDIPAAYDAPNRVHEGSADPGHPWTTTSMTDLSHRIAD
jgi:hypothetical protein